MVNYPKEHLQFSTDGVILQRGQALKKYFKQEVNEMDIQLINMVRLKICYQESIWVSNIPQITSLQQLKDKITFDHVRMYNDNLVESLEAEEKFNDENRDRKKAYYANMLQFVYRRRKILESEDLTEKLPQGVFTN